MWVLGTIILGLVVILVVSVYLKYRRVKGHWKRLGVDEVNLPDMTKKMLNGTITFVDLDLLIYKELRGKRFGGFLEVFSPAFSVLDLDLIKSILIKDFDHFVDRRGVDVEKQDPHFHLNLFNQAGDDWKELRSKMSPAFTTGKIRRMFQIFDTSCQKLVKAINSRGIGKEEVDVRDFHGKVTMDIIASVAFGVQTDLFEDPDSYFAKMSVKIQETFTIKAKNFIILLAPRVAELFKLKITDAEADRFFSKVITDRLNHRTKTGEKREDFLQLMLEARQGVIKQEDENLLDEHEKSAKLETSGTAKSKIDFSDDLIIAQSLLFIIGGFDTVESLLTWAMYSLALNPDVQEKLHDEVKQSFELNEDTFTYDSILAMDYMERFVQEVLRMYPAVFRLERRSVKPYKIPGSEIVLPKGSLVTVPILALQRDPNLWPEPEKFDPDRFLRENVSKRHPCAYLPFGAGPRNCIGNRFALVEGKLIIANLILNFKFAPSKQTLVPPKFANSGSLKPIDGMWLNITSRN